MDVYLKQVELENFKSFGGKLTIPLMEGYMAVTGPNGSGKSNITDAILFVLGPKSSKAVRAGRLTDLVFDGGKSRNKAGYTKVSLVFDNADRLMPWDDDIVRLTRYVKISDNGQDYSSYFFINDRKSTLTEFDSLLTRARISADGYNMVQQGDVTRIVQMGNMERRRVLDSISGIASYDADIDKANRERSEAEINLDRINIVITELQAQLERLEKDREDARRYIETQRTLETAKAQLVHRQVRIEEAKLEALSKQVLDIQNEIGALNERKQAIRQEHLENEEAILRKEDEIAEQVGPEYKEIKTSIENVKIRMATQKDRAERATEDLESLSSSKEQFEESIAENLRERDSASQNLADVVIELEDCERSLEAAKREDQEINDEMTRHGGEHATLQGRLNDLEASIDSKEVEEHDVQVALAKAESYLEDVSRAKANLDERLQSAAFDLKDAEWNLQQVKAETGAVNTDEISRRILEAKRKEAEYERQEGELKEAIRRLDSEYNELSAEKRVSERVNRGSSATAAIIELRDRGQMTGIHGTIQELITVEPGYETALSVAAGGKMQSVIVDNDQVAADCIAFLKKERLGRVTFLPLNKMIGGKPRAKAIMTVKQTLGYATDLVDSKPEYVNALWYVFQDTLVVGTINEARALMGGIRLVTKGGEVIEASGAMAGGTISPQQILKFGSSSESKLEEVGAKLRNANNALDALRAQMRELRDTIRGLDDEMRSISTQGMGAQAQIGQLTARISELRKAKQSLTDEFSLKEKELTDADVAMRSAKKELGELSSELEYLRTERTETRAKIASIAPVEMQERIRKVRDLVYEYNNKASDLKSERVTLETEMAGLDKQRESLEAQRRSVIGKISSNESWIANHQSELERLTVEMSALRAMEREMESSIEGLKNEKDALVERRYKLEGERGSNQEKIEMKEGVRISAEAQMNIVNENLDGLRAEIEALTIDVGEIPSEEELRRTIRSCENLLSKIGNVNLRAIEDYEERKGRYDMLMSDVQRLNTQIKELLSLTESLNSQKKGLFMQSYNAVDVNFREIYAQLSGGGEAYMGLECEDDPFLGGLTINAKPKNGKLLKLESLSGGEKSLTALAFIFAIQEYQPSPFYVLDEVDMFLDSVNAEMVARRVKEGSAKAQFIQVSLRKVTLATADHLIGVTRPPSGISKVIMQPDLAEVSKYEEEAIKNNEVDT